MVKKLRQNGDFFGFDFGMIEEVGHLRDACSNNMRQKKKSLQRSTVENEY
jgi:hypothetical protein